MIDCEEFFKNRCHQLPRKCGQSFGGSFSVEKEVLANFVNLGKDTCDEHTGEERAIICLECRDFVCVQCLVQSHQSHLWSDLDEIARLFQKFTAFDEVKVVGCLSQGRDRKRKLFEEKADFLREVDASERAIIKAGEELKEIVDRHTEALIHELSHLKMRKINEIETERQEVEKELKILEMCCKEMELNLGDTVAKDAFLSRSTEEGDVLVEERNSQNRAAMIVFQEANILEQLKANGCNLLGKLKAEFNFKDRLIGEQQTTCLNLIDFPDEAIGFKTTTTDNEDYHVTDLLTAVLDTDDWSVFGVAAMQNRLYVLLCNSILVFEAREPFTRINDIKAPGFMYPFDLTACPLIPCLYVTDDGYGCVWKVDADHQVTRWLQGIGEPSTLSVSVHTGEVTIVRSGQPSSLEVYDQQANLLRILPLPDDVMEPQHAVATSCGDTIVCFRQRNSKVWCVCAVTLEGHVTVRCELRDAFHHLASTPCHLALDEVDRVIVADWQRKIDLFDSQLNWDRTLISSQRNGLERPERICYDRINKLLLVVHGWGKKTYVYRHISTNITDGLHRTNRW